MDNRLIVSLYLQLALKSSSLVANEVKSSPRRVPLSPRPLADHPSLGVRRQESTQDGCDSQAISPNLALVPIC